LKVLVVDDDEAKSRAIVESLERSLSHSCRPSTITVVKTLAEAVRVLSLVAFDLIVLDLMLPYLPGGPPDSHAGLELLRQLRSEEGPNKATSVISISAFPNEVVEFRPSFEEVGVLIITFDDDGSWSRALLHVLERVSAQATTKIELDFLIICALEEERSGFASTAFEKVSEAIVSGLNVHYVRLAGSRELFGGIVRLSQIGLVAATFETASALSVFRAKVLCMSGICAGFSSQAELGQLVIASPAWEYQAGKWSANRFEIAPVQIPLRPDTRATLDQAIGREDFTRYLESDLPTGQQRPTRQSKPILAPFATGSAVIADARRLQHIEKQHRKVAALDMETFGLYFAAHERTSAVEHFFSVKCVVDLADVDKRDDLHPYGCAVSARAAEQLIRSLLASN
jgi:nucleoside phosphorylase/CheY-like chemotaxis protein